jgi:signal transduction histidine kinase
MERPIERTYDLRPMLADGGGSPVTWLRTRLRLIHDALAVFFEADDRLVAYLGQPNLTGGDFLEIVLPIGPLKDAMVRHGLNILGLSIFISALAGGLVYLALNSLFVQPLTRLTRNMVRFSANPEDSSRIIQPSTRGDEIGTAERELAHMQGELNQMLAQKNRLAALGLAVSKINHDMRNMLANAQLLSDNLTSVKDPRVQRFAPKLIASLDRAINFCNDTLRFGRAAEATPRRDLFVLRPLVEEVGEGLGLPRRTGTPSIDWHVEIDDSLRVDADRDQLYRVLSNLTRNAVQAIEAQQPVRAGEITISARREGRRVVVDVVDDGPGLPAIAKAHLFEAFQGSTRRGGSGLGLAIAHELVTAHGGRIELVETGQAHGTHFRMTLPDRVVQA